MSQRESENPLYSNGPIVSLVYRVAPDNRNILISFLERSLPLYERPGGIRIALFESLDEPGLMLELVLYDSESDYTVDQERVENDPEMQRALAEWHGLLSGPVEVMRMSPVGLKRTAHSRTGGEQIAQSQQSDDGSTAT